MYLLMTALMAWATVQTGLPMPQATPNLVLMDRCEIERLHAGNPEHVCREDGLKVLAAYDPRSRTILLADTWSPASFVDVSILLHELVHHMQAEAGLTGAASCKARELELPAYDAQIAFIEAAGMPGLETIGINGLTYILLTNCER